MADERHCLLALTMIPRIGPVVARQLLAGCGSAEAVFKEKKSNLLRLPNIGKAIVQEIKPDPFLGAAEKEMRWMERKGVTMLTIHDGDYPVRLRHIESSPPVLFYKGNADLNALRTVAVVGTRSPSEYGKAMCRKLIDEFIPYQPLIVSGLAYGIDILAHKACLDVGLKTIAVLGHGLDKIYPSQHASVAEAMINQGGILSEFVSGTLPDRENFPMRNRIIAGLSDVVAVAESGKKGGSMITAEFANDYNKDVFAFPGQVDMPYSHGGNYLIKSHKAHLMESAADVADMMGWDGQSRPKTLQTQLLLDLSDEEQHVVAMMRGQSELHIDALIYRSTFPPGAMASVLLNLERKGLIRSLPGKKYALV